MPPKSMRRSRAEFESSANPDSPPEAATQQSTKRRSTCSNTQQAPTRTERPVTRSTAQLAASKQPGTSFSRDDIRRLVDAEQPATKPKGRHRPRRTEAQLLATSTQEAGHSAFLSSAERSVLEREVLQPPQESTPATSRSTMVTGEEYNQLAGNSEAFRSASADSTRENEPDNPQQEQNHPEAVAQLAQTPPEQRNSSPQQQQLMHPERDEEEVQRCEQRHQEDLQWCQQEQARLELEIYQQHRRDQLQDQLKDFLRQLEEEERQRQREQEALRQQAEMEEELRKQQYLEELESQRLDEQHAVGELLMNHWATPHGSSDESDTDEQYALVEQQPEQVLTESPIPPPVDSLHALRIHSPLTTPGGSQYRTSPPPHQPRLRESYEGDENAVATEPIGPNASSCSLVTSTPKRDSRKTVAEQRHKASQDPPGRIVRSQSRGRGRPTSRGPVAPGTSHSDPVPPRDQVLPPNTRATNVNSLPGVSPRIAHSLTSQRTSSKVWEWEKRIQMQNEHNFQPAHGDERRSLTNPDEHFRVVLVPSEERSPQKRETVQNKFSPNDQTEYPRQQQTKKTKKPHRNNEVGNQVNLNMPDPRCSLDDLQVAGGSVAANQMPPHAHASQTPQSTGNHVHSKALRDKIVNNTPRGSLVNLARRAPTPNQPVIPASADDQQRSASIAHQSTSVHTDPGITEMRGLVDRFRMLNTIPCNQGTQDVATRTSEPAQSPQVNLVPPDAHPEHLLQTPLGRRQFTADVRRMWTTPQGGHPRCDDSICHDAMCPGTPNSYLGDRMQAAQGPDPGAPGTGYPCPVHRIIHQYGEHCDHFMDDGKRVRHRDMRRGLQIAQERAARGEDLNQVFQAAVESRRSRGPGNVTGGVPPSSTGAGGHTLPPQGQAQGSSAQPPRGRQLAAPQLNQQNQTLPQSTRPQNAPNSYPQVVSTLHHQPTTRSQLVNQPNLGAGTAACSTRGTDCTLPSRRAQPNDQQWPNQQQPPQQENPWPQQQHYSQYVQSQHLQQQLEHQRQQLEQQALQQRQSMLQALDRQQQWSVQAQQVQQVPLQAQPPRQWDSQQVPQDHWNAPQVQPSQDWQQQQNPPLPQRESYWSSTPAPATQTQRANRTTGTDRSPSPSSKGKWNISKFGWKMPNFDGKQPQQYFLDSWAERWRSLQKEKNLQGKQAVWAMQELITGVAKDKLYKRMGKRLNQVEDTEVVIKELYEIYDSQGNFRRARREFEDRDQKPNESLRDYLESLLALHREADQDSSLPSENERVCRRFLRGLRDPELAHPAMQRLLLAEKHKESEYDEEYLQKILTIAEAQKQATRDEQKTQRRDPHSQQLTKAREETTQNNS